MRGIAICALAALVLVPAAVADHTRDIWEGTWRLSGFASTLVLKPASDAQTRAQAPPCTGAGRTLYTGAYTGSRSGTVAACAQRYSLTAKLYERGRRAGDLAVSWAVGVAPDGTVGKPTFGGTSTFGRVAATWVRHGGTLPKTTSPKTGLTAQQAVGKVEAILRRNAVRCEMTWTTIRAKKTANGYQVTATVRTFGNAGTALWNVVGARVTPADPLAADIAIGCP